MTDQEIDVDGFHRSGAYATLSNGEVVPITNWIDEWGEDCGPFEHPVFATAGPDARGNFWSLDLSEFEPLVTQ